MEFEQLKDYAHLSYLICLAIACFVAYGTFYSIYYSAYRLFKLIKQEQAETDFLK